MIEFVLTPCTLLGFPTVAIGLCIISMHCYNSILKGCVLVGHKPTLVLRVSVNFRLLLDLRDHVTIMINNETWNFIYDRKNIHEISLNPIIIITTNSNLMMQSQINKNLFLPVDSVVVDFRGRWWLLLFLVVSVLPLGDREWLHWNRGGPTFWLHSDYQVSTGLRNNE